MLLVCFRVDRLTVRHVCPELIWVFEVVICDVDAAARDGLCYLVLFRLLRQFRV